MSFLDEINTFRKRINPTLYHPSLHDDTNDDNDDTNVTTTSDHSTLDKLLNSFSFSSSTSNSSTISTNNPYLLPRTNYPDEFIYSSSIPPGGTDFYSNYISKYGSIQPSSMTRKLERVQIATSSTNSTSKTSVSRYSYQLYTISSIPSCLSRLYGGIPLQYYFTLISWCYPRLREDHLDYNSLIVFDIPTSVYLYNYIDKQQPLVASATTLPTSTANSPSFAFIQDICTLSPPHANTEYIDRYNTLKSKIPTTLYSAFSQYSKHRKNNHENQDNNDASSSNIHPDPHIYTVSSLFHAILQLLYNIPVFQLLSVCHDLCVETSLQVFSFTEAMTATTYPTIHLENMLRMQRNGEVTADDNEGEGEGEDNQMKIQHPGSFGLESIKSAFTKTYHLLYNKNSKYLDHDYI